MNSIVKALKDDTRKMTKGDWIIVTIIVIAYSILSFINLGSMKNPQTFRKFKQQWDTATLEINGDAKFISKIRHFSGEEVGENYQVYGSIDGQNYENITAFADTYVFKWEDTPINKKLKYLRISSIGTKHSYSYIGEVQFYDENGNKVSATAANADDKLLVDEPKTVPDTISYLNSVYFDEVYFPRTAYDYANNMTAYENVHPPLGKLIQMIPIITFGMTPFAYRLMGNIAGILMVLVMYVFGKSMFKRSKYAILAAILMAFDNFHFAQTRMGTVDSFLALFVLLSGFFMFKYIMLKPDDDMKEKIKNLFWSGLFFGLSVCVKWTGMYAGLGLCIMFFYKMISEIVKAKKFDKKYIKIMLWCVLFFIIIPATIYVLSYFLFPNVAPYGSVSNFNELVRQTKMIYDYHSKLNAEHPYTSKWYTWPLTLKPVWLYVDLALTDGTWSTIVGLGNPAIWWMRSSCRCSITCKNSNN